MENQTPYQYPPQQDPQPQNPPVDQPPQPQYAPQPQPSAFSQPVIDHSAITQQTPDIASHRPQVAMIAVTVAALIIAVGSLSYAALSTRKTSQKAAPVVTKESVVTPLTAGMAIEYARGFFGGTDVAKTSLSTPVSTKDHTYLTIVSDPKAVAKTSIAGSLTPKDSDTTLSALRKAMGDQKFAETVLTDGTNGTNFLADYNRSGVACQIFLEKPKDTAANSYLEAKCLDQKQYETLADMQEPFYKAYSAASASSASAVLIGAAQITPSATPGYQIAEQRTAAASTPHVVTAGPMIKFYAAADGIWHYFTDTSGVLACSVFYKQPDTTAAYAGTPCLDDKKQTVQVLPKKK